MKKKRLEDHHLKKVILFLALMFFSNVALAEDIDAESRAEVDISEDLLDAQYANFAFMCNLRGFDWVSAINSMVLERAATDIEALKQAGDSSGDIRTQWETIARGMTVRWDPDNINCNNVNSDITRLDVLAAKGGYSGS